MDSRNYSAVNSSRLIQGEQNTYSDASQDIRIGQSLNEKNEQVAALEDLITKLKSSQMRDEGTEKGLCALENVRDEITEATQPDKERMQKWLEAAKSTLKTAALGFDVTEAVKKLFTMFGM